MKAMPKMQLIGNSNNGNHEALESLRITITNQQLELADQKNRVESLVNALQQINTQMEKNSTELQHWKQTLEDRVNQTTEAIKTLSQTKEIQKLIRLLEKQ